MTASLTLTQEDIRQAVREHMERQGWIVGAVEVKAHRGYDAGSDPRERSTPDTVSATVTVSPKPAPRLTGYEDR